MVEIRLDEKEKTEYQGTNEKVTVKASQHDKNFEKVTYNIEYINTYADTVWNWYFYSYLVYLYIKDFDGLKIFEYRVPKGSDIIYTVEAYYSKQYSNIPLVIKFKRKYDEAYYTFYNLRKQVYYKGYPPNSFKAGKSEKELNQKLQDEDNRVNRVKFTIGGKYQNCNETRGDATGNFKKICYNAEDKNRYENHYLTKHQIFTHETGIDVDDSYFSSVNDQYFDEVCVYRTNEDHSKILLVEFINQPNKVKKYFLRQDKHGYYWIQKQVENVTTELQKIEDEYRNKLVYLINKTVNYRGVDFSINDLPSFKKDSHKPDLLSTSYKTTFIFHGVDKLQLEGNTSFTAGPRLNGFENKNFTEVCLYYWKFPQSNKPDYLKLKENPQTGGGSSGSTNTYYLQKSGDSWSKWKQITDPGLDDVITFLIDHKVDNGQSYNGSINVSTVPHDSFNVYEHTPQGAHTGKKAYLLYNFEFLELETKTETEVTPKLKNIQLNKCCKVTVYFFKAETASYNSTIPIYLELQENGTSNKYYLQRTDSQAIRWKQIPDPNLTNTITYLLDQKLESRVSYNNSVTVSKGEHVSFDIYIHKPQHKDKLGLLLYQYNLLTIEKNKIAIEPELKEIHHHKYSCITVYYFKLSSAETLNNPPIYLKLIENSTECNQADTTNSESKTYYLERTGPRGTNWNQIQDPKLDNVITFLLDKDPAKGTSYNGNSVIITKEPHSSFIVVKHTPGTGHDTKKGILRFNDKDLQLEQNDSIEDKNKIIDFKGHVYCQVSLFYYNGRTSEVPQFLELKVKGTSSSEGQQDCTNTSNCYLLQRNDTKCVKWKQIDYQNLKETVTYQLEFKDDKKQYNDGSVTVTKSVNGSFDKYSHKPSEPTKLALLLYKWETLTLQPNDDTGITKKLEKLHGNKYCTINVYYSNRHPKEPPLFLELVINNGSGESCRPTKTEESTNSISYWLERVDPDGHHWKQVTKQNKFDPETARQIVTEIFSNDKNSIVVKLTERNWYDLNLIKHYEKIGTGVLTNPPKKVEVNEQILSNSTYKYYTHGFSQSSDIRSANIERLRTYISTVEIKVCNTGGSEQILTYKPFEHSEKKVYVYYYPGDHIPLMLCYNQKWYAPTLKNDFFSQWTEKSGISSLIDYAGLKTKLDQINKNFNEILLDNTSENGYGITVPKGREPPSGFDTTRVKVEQTGPSTGQSFGKVTHSTKNNSSIGEIKFGTIDLQDSTSKKLSDQVLSDTVFVKATVNSVTAFYHKNDSEFKKPLLLGFTKSGQVRNVGNPEMFYERESVGDTSKWKKIDGSELRNLKTSDDNIANKINTIHYDIGKSIKIRVDHQSDEGGSGSGTSQYQVQLVPNTNGGSTSGTESVGGDKTITVSKDTCTPTRTPPLNYTCFKHTIPPEIGPTGSHYVSGLKLYVCENKYLETHDKGGSFKFPIHYDTSHNHVKVYFYGNGTSNTPLDKVPLLVEYNDAHYKPQTRDGYFDKWVQKDIPTGDGRGDVDQLPQTGKVLYEINREMNTIELDKTGNGEGESYGIKAPKPSEGVNCTSTTPVSTFCERVTVTRDRSQSTYYLKVTHKTVNKGPIGAFKYGGQPVTGIKTDDLGNGCNKVEVYYRASDNEYKNPLLICITTQDQGQEGSSTCKKWFSRQGIDVKLWNNADNDDGKFKDGPSIKSYLEQIQTKLSNYLDLDISQQKPYQGFVQKGSVSEKGGNKHTIGEIKVSPEYGTDQYNPDNYRPFKHHLHDYYSNNKDTIRTTLELDSDGVGPTLQVRIYLDSIYIINFLGTDGGQLDNPLTYGQTEADRGDSNHVLVYFYEPETYGTGTTDTVPLLFKYGDRYFGPNSKKEYFKNWKEVTINTGGAQNIKKHLDNINTQLNEIDLEQTSSVTGPGGKTTAEYGLPDPGGGTTLTPGFDTKRITVTRSQITESTTISTYTLISHTTTNGFNIGSIKALGDSCQFDNTHTSALSDQKHNQAIAVYPTSDISTLGTPSLVLIAQSKRGLGTSNQSSTVHGYYDLSGGCPNGGKYGFKKVQTGFTLSELTSKDKVSGEKELLGILTKLNIVAPEVQRAQAASSDSARGVHDGDARGGSSDGMGAGSKAGQGAHGENGVPGQIGDRGLAGQEGPQGPPTEATVTRPTPTLGDQSHQHTGGGGNGRSNEVEASPQGGGGGSGASENTNGTMDEVLKIIQKPEVYASASAVGGVSVIGGVGAVVYKN